MIYVCNRSHNIFLDIYDASSEFASIPSIFLITLLLNIIVKIGNSFSFEFLKYFTVSMSKYYLMNFFSYWYI